MSSAQFDDVNALTDGDATTIEAFRVPHAIVTGPDGEVRWVARCPTCAANHHEVVVSGDEDHARATCAGCGETVEVCLSGIYRIAPTLAPPAE